MTHTLHTGVSFERVPLAEISPLFEKIRAAGWKPTDRYLDRWSVRFVQKFPDRAASETAHAGLVAILGEYWVEEFKTRPAEMWDIDEGEG
jgi:hypothetical protein